MRIIIIAIFMLVTSIAVACDKTRLEPSEAFNKADVVFKGKVENLRYLDEPDKTKTEPKIIVTFVVSEIWKGPEGQIITIHTTHNRTTCNGFVFKSGEEYLVYSRYSQREDNFLAKLFAPDRPTLGVKVYGGTKLISEAEKDLKYLGKEKVY